MAQRHGESAGDSAVGARDDPEMKNILVAIDDTEGTGPASPLIQRSVALARAFSSKVWLVHVIPKPGLTPFTVPRELLRSHAAAELRHEHKSVQELARYLRDSGTDASALLVEGTTVKTILREAERLNADLIVVTSHRHSLLYRALLDGAGERLLNESSRPVMFVPEARQAVAEHPGDAEPRQPRSSQRGQ
jgi:nucleotide-binding universal stress UspA family protein